MQVFRTAILAAGISALVVGGPPVWAAPLVFTDTIASSTCVSLAAPAACSGGSPSVAGMSWTHDILDSGFLPTDVVTGAQLELTLWDDGGPKDANEKLSLTVDLVSLLHNADANHDTTVILSDLSALSDGVLAVVLGALDGDFFFGGSTLTVWVEHSDAPSSGPTEGDSAPTSAAPGPPTLLALGAGLLLIGGLRRRRLGSLGS